MSGVNTVDDLRDRCFVNDITGCWQWRGALSAGKYPSLWLPDLGKRVTMGTAVAYLMTGRVPEAGVYWYCRCATSNCANPFHRKAGNRSDQMLSANLSRSPLVRARIASSRRVNSKITEESVHAIVTSTQTLAVEAERFHISIAHASRIRRRERRVQAGMSVFCMGTST